MTWELEKNLESHSPYFQNTSEPSNASTNIVNAPREPYVVKQDYQSFVDKIIFDLNIAPDSPNQFHCFHCKDVLRDGEACKRCTCAKCRSGLGKGLCYICGHNRNSLNDSPSISETSSQSPPNINHCCYECGDPLDGIFCKRCTCMFCGKDTHIRYNCPSKVPVISNPEPCNNQTIDELPQTLPIFHPTFHSKVESLVTLDSTPTYVDESPNVFNHLHNLLCILVNFTETMLIMVTIVHLNLCLSIRRRVTIKTLISRKIFKLFHNNILVVMIAGLLMTLTNQYLDELKRLSNLEYHDEVKIAELTKNFNGMSIEIQKTEKLLQQEQWAYLSTHPSKRLHSFCFDDDDDEEYTSAITLDEPVLSTEEPDNSLSMRDEHLDTISATESDEFIKSGVKNLILILSEFEGIPEHMCDVPSHDNSPPLDVSKDQFEDFFESNKEFSSIDDDSFSIDDIDFVEASPLDSELVSSEVMDIVIPEVGGIDDDILLTIKDDILREKLLNVNLLIAKIEALNANPTPSSECKTKFSSTSLNSLLEETNTFDNSLPEFETFCFDVEEISSGSTTTHPDISLLKYEAFHDDHVKEISSGIPTTHSDSFLYVSFIFDLSINPFPHADRSDSYEFTDELIPFISPPEYDCFLFKVEANSRDFTKDVVEDISSTKEPQVLNTLPTHPTL
nr:hypothetical protein [Tanacetum cinerariifolium]